MILGLSLGAFLKIHVLLSLLGIAAGLVVLVEMVRDKRAPGWTALFLATTALTSVTGFPLPPFGFDPPRVIGTLSLVLLAIAIAALYAFKLAGAWRWIYVTTAVVALYFNSFVAVIQAFQKVPALHVLAPTQAEPPFVIAQVAVLALFIAFGAVAVRRFGRPAVAHGAATPS